MNDFVDSFAYWLADFHLAVTVLLAASLAVVAACAQPARRLAVTKAAIVASALLAALCAIPGWSIVSLGGVDATEVAALEPVSRPPVAAATSSDVVRSIPAEQPAPVTHMQPPSATPSVTAGREISRRIVVLAVYLVGSATVVVWLAAGAIAAQRLVRDAEDAPAGLRDLMPSSADLARLQVSQQIAVPVALGVWRPRVLLPRDWIDSHSKSELTTVLAHEAAHIRNGDLAWLAASRVLLIALWAHPLYWWLRRQMRLDQETLADAAAADVAGRRVYAEQLVTWARDVAPHSRRLLPASVGLWEGASQLRRRVAVLVDEGFAVLRQCPPAWRRITTIVALLGAIAISFVTWEPSQSEETSVAKEKLPAEEVNRVAEAIRVLRETEGIGERPVVGLPVADDWAAAIRTLVEIGQPAVPMLIASLDEEQRDHPISKLAFTLRAIGDPRAVPALIRAIPRTLVPGRSDYGLRIADPELLKFMQQHDLTPSNGGDNFDYGRSFREVVMALQKITGTNQNDMELNWVMLGETESQRRIQRRLFHQLAKKWADWWAENWKHFGVDESFAAVDLVPLVENPDAETATSLPIGSEFGLKELHSEWIVEPARESGRRCFVDLDTSRQGDWPKELTPVDELGMASEQASQWAREQGFDLVGIRFQPDGFETPMYCLQPLGMKVWEITPEEQRNLVQATRGEIPYPLSKSVDLFVPRQVQYHGPDKHELGGTSFLFLTQEGTAGLLRMTAQVTDTRLQVGRPSTKDDQFSPVGFYRGAKISFSVIAETEEPPSPVNYSRPVLRFSAPVPSGPPQAPVAPEELKSFAVEASTESAKGADAIPPAALASESTGGLSFDPLGLPVAEDELAGVVQDESGKPLTGVTVDAWTWFPGNETTTDADGRFTLKGLNAREPVEVQFTKAGFCPRLFVAEPTGKPDWVVTLNDRTYLEGRVLDPAGQPVAGINIRATRGPFETPDGSRVGAVWTETETDSSGRYRIYLEPDTYELRVRRSGVGVARHEQVVVRENDRRGFDLQLEAGPTFRARVIDSVTGEPVGGIRLFRWREPEIVGTSNEEGELRIENMLPGRYEFNVSAAQEKSRFQHIAGDYARWWSSDALKEWQRLDPTDRGKGFQRNFDGLEFDIREGMEPVTIVVERGVTIRGHVVDPDGNPVEGATVAPAKTGSGNSLTGDTRYSVRTDAEGKFEMRLPASGEAKYNLVAHDGDYFKWRKWANGVGELLQTKPGDEVENVTLQLSRPCIVRGRVLDANDKPVANHPVRAHAADKKENRYYDPTTETDERGEFELRFVRPGKHYIQADPFWLVAEQGPRTAWQLVNASAERPVEEVVLKLGGANAPSGSLNILLQELKDKAAED